MKKVKSGVLLLLFVLLTGAVLSQKPVPYEPKENFGFELDYKFKTRPPPQSDKFEFSKSSSARGNQVLPYLTLKFDWSSLGADYYKYKVENNFGQMVKNKKIKSLDTYILDMGFSDDLKDKVTPHKYNIYFFNKQKERISRIEVEVAENGDLLLNGKFHGRI